MVLRDDLVDTDIPGRDKMTEVIISQWGDAVEQLKSDFSVGIVICLSTLLTVFGHRSPAGGSVSLQMSGQARTCSPT